jgi:sec-independent protein translocase protein TatB
VFGMSLGEIIIIAIIAILFIGPDKLPEAMVKVAKFFRSFKKTINETKETIEQEIHLSELKEEALSYKNDLDSVVNEYKLDTDINVMDDINNGLKEIENSVKDIATKSDEPTLIEDKIKKKKSKKKKKKKELGDKDV